MTFGYQASKIVPGFTADDFDTGYVDVFASELHSIEPAIQVVNYGCPGESSSTFIRSGCPVALNGFPLHDPFSGPQLDAAIAFLRAHRGEVSPVASPCGAMTSVDSSRRAVRTCLASCRARRRRSIDSPRISTRSSRG